VEVRDRTLELAERNRELENLNLQLKEAILTDPAHGARQPALSAADAHTVLERAGSPGSET